MRQVDLVDTNVFAALVGVPGREHHQDEILKKFDEKIADGVTFILPVSTLIETGNMIANASGDRRKAALKFIRALELARANNPPWTIRDVAWDTDFLQRFIDGASTQTPLAEHMSAGTMGSGDMAILVERDLLEESMSNTTVRVWTYDSDLLSYGG